MNNLNEEMSGVFRILERGLNVERPRRRGGGLLGVGSGNRALSLARKFFNFLNENGVF